MGVARKRHEPGTFRLHVRKGDTVLVLAGKDKGKQGRIIEALPRKERVTVDGVNLVTRHQKPRSLQPTARQQAGRIPMPAPLHVSNVQLVCPNCNQATKIAHREIEGRSARTCKNCGELVDKQK